MAALTATVVNYTLTTRQQSNRGRTVPSEASTPSLALVRSSTAAASGAAADTMTVTVSQNTYYIRGGFASSTATTTLGRLTHQSLNATQGFVADGPGGIALQNCAANGGVDTGLVPVVPGATVVLSATASAATVAYYVYEYGYRAVDPGSLRP